MDHGRHGRETRERGKSEAVPLLLLGCQIFSNELFGETHQVVKESDIFKDVGLIVKGRLFKWIVIDIGGTLTTTFAVCLVRFV